MLPNSYTCTQFFLWPNFVDCHLVSTNFMLFNILGTKEILKNQQYFNVKRVKPSFSYISVTPFSYSYEI